MLRTTNSSPGLAAKIVAGSTRLSAPDYHCVWLLLVGETLVEPRLGGIPFAPELAVAGMEIIRNRHGLVPYCKGSGGFRQSFGGLFCGRQRRAQDERTCDTGQERAGQDADADGCCVLRICESQRADEQAHGETNPREE